MDVRRLEMLLELSRVGSMGEVAQRMHTTTSTVSQQLGVLARETGVALTEPDGRRVRLTPAGRRLAEHAATIVAAVETARLDLDPDAAPSGTVHVAGFATAVCRQLLPLVRALAAEHPDVKVVVREHEPTEALDLLAAGAVDLALTYDYNLAPAPDDPALETVALWSVPWGLAVPAAAARGVAGGDTLAVFAAFRDHEWIGNSRNRADAVVVHLLASMAGFTPRLGHEADSLEVVEELIVAGLGVGLLPANRQPRGGIALLPLTDPDVRLRAFAHVRRGRSAWPPVKLVLDHLAA